MRIRSVDDFGAVARQRRRDLGLSQEELARRAGVTRQWLVRFERGNTDVSLSKMFAVFAGLDFIVRADPSEAVASGKSSGLALAIPKADIPEAGRGTAGELLTQALEALRRLDEAQSRSEETSDE